MELDTSNVASFKVDHTKLKVGLFVSRKDFLGSNCITTFDIRMKRPYHDEVMTTGSIHALEHIIATYLRSDSLWGNHVIYFGPMGCRTGFYLLLRDDVSYENAIKLTYDAFKFTSEFDGVIPGSTKIECGNYLEHDLEGAKAVAKDMMSVLENYTPEMMIYEV